MIPPEFQSQSPSLPPSPSGRDDQRPNDGLLPAVKWGPLDVVVGATVTMLVVVTILSFGGAAGTFAGFDTSISTPAGYLVGALTAALAILLARISRSPVWPVVLAMVIGAGIVSVSYLVASDAGDGVAELVGIPVSIIAITAMSGSFAVIGLAFSVVRYREPLSALGFVSTSGLGPYLFAAGMWIIGLSVLVAWLQLVIWLDIDQLLPPDTARKALDESGNSIVITILLVGVAGPIAEEVFFRGFALTGLVKRFGVRRALLLSSLMFGLFHIDPGAIVPTFALGLMLGWVYLKTRSIWPAIFAHALHNTFAVLLARYGTGT